MGSAVDMPEAPEVPVVAPVLPPRRVGDHVTVLTEEQFDKLEDPWMTDRFLDKAAAIEQLVAKWAWTPPANLLWHRADIPRRPVDLGAERCQLLAGEDRRELGIALGPERLDLSRHRVGSQQSDIPSMGRHATILPSPHGPAMVRGAGSVNLFRPWDFQDKSRLRRAGTPTMPRRPLSSRRLYDALGLSEWLWSPTCPSYGPAKRLSTQVMIVDR